ncbi:putative transporter ESBP6 [Nakaseomyces bracarensis]|uniref:Transporter ESBP6 n=1 Tax=Nakaseomyces bracarensis TaxID=273131 RepID=A0ABR4NP88_9SACH
MVSISTISSGMSRAERKSIEVRSYTGPQYSDSEGEDSPRDEGIWRALTNDGTSLMDIVRRPSSTNVSKTVLGSDEEEEQNRILETHFELADAMQLYDKRSICEDDIETVSRVSDKSGESLTKVPTIKKVFTNQSTGELDLPPDGGYGWVCAFCVFLAMFSTWGCNSGFGVFLGFYLNNESYPGATKYDYALIAGLTVFLGQGFSPFVMVMMRVIGMKTTMLLGDAVLLAGFLLASFSKKIWQLYLTQGVMAGCSIAMVCVPATVVLPGWFLKKRAVAMGLSLLGTGLGGVVYGLAANKMIQTQGNTRLALRVLAITCSVSILVATALVKERVPKKSVGLKSWKKIREQFRTMFTINLYRKPFVLLIAVWFSFALLGYIIMVFTMSPYAIARGMSAHDASTLTAILNGAQSIGRPCMGLAGDRFGRTNVTIVLTCCLSIFLFGFWIPAYTFVQLIFFSICVGSCVGVANVMNTVLIADMVGPEEFLPAWAFVCYIGSPLCLVAEVIAQALTVPSHTQNPYLHTQIFAGCCFVFALTLALMLREYSVRLKFTREKDAQPEKGTSHGDILDNTPSAYFRRMTMKMII